MYAVYDRKNLIAVHDDKHVAEKYIKSVYSCHGIELELRKIKRSSLSEEKRDSLYLTRYADTYVQSGYFSNASAEHTPRASASRFSLILDCE